MPDNWSDQVNAYAVQWKQTAWDVGNSRFKIFGIPTFIGGRDDPSMGGLPDQLYDALMLFAAPDDPDVSGDLANSFKQASDTLAENRQSELTRPSDTIGQYWEGTAAENFSAYLSTVDDAFTGLQNILDSQYVALQRYNSIVTHLRDNIHQLNEKASEQLKESELEPGEVRLELADAAIEMIGDHETGGVVSALGKAAVNITVAWESDKTKQEGVLRAFLASLDELHQNTTEELDKVVNAFALINTNIQNQTPDGTVHVDLQPAPPELVSAPSFDPSGFQPVGAAQRFGAISHDRLVSAPAPTAPIGPKDNQKNGPSSSVDKEGQSTAGAAGLA